MNDDDTTKGPSRQPPAAPPHIGLRARVGRLRRTRMMVRQLKRTMREQGLVQTALTTQLAAVEKRLGAVEKRLGAVDERLSTLTATTKRLEGSFKPFERASALREVEHGRFSAQFGAVEQRLGRLEQAAADGRITGTEDSIRAATDVLDAVRREHEQVRVRLQIISAYEERLRRVESAVVSLVDDDPRQQV